MFSKSLLSVVDMKLSCSVASVILCVVLPMSFAAPSEDAIKQQIAAGLLRDDLSPYWSYNQVFTAWINDDSPTPRFACYFYYSTAQGKYYTHLRKPLDVMRIAQQKRFDSLSGTVFGMQKRNFDEIDRNGFGSFVKRNFDEIDRTGLGFNKRNFDEIDRTGLGFHQKRNFDEIDRTGFGSFVKRAAL